MHLKIESIKEKNDKKDKKDINSTSFHMKHNYKNN